MGLSSDVGFFLALAVLKGIDANTSDVDGLYADIYLGGV